MLRSGDDGENWQWIDTPASGRLRDLEVRADGAVSVTGEGGVVLLSTDGGATWTDVGPGFGAARDHLWRDASEGYVVGDSLAHRTLDGGATWDPMFPPMFFGHDGLFFAGARTVVVLQNGSHWVSEDGGAGWTEVQRFTRPFYQVAGVGMDADHWITVSSSEGGELWETLDGGDTWTQLLERDCAGFTALERLPGGRLVVGSDIGDLLVSDDDGRTWTNRAGNVTGDAVSSSIQVFAPGSAGVVFAGTSRALTGGRTWMRSDDGGLHWTRPVTQPPFAVYGASFHDADRGLVRGTTAVAATTDGGARWVDQTLAAPFETLAGVDATLADRWFATVRDGTNRTGRVLRSRDLGATWQTVGGGLPAGFQAGVIALHDTGVGLVADGNGNGSMHRTTDGGETWTRVAWAGGIPSSLSWVDASLVFAVGNGEVWRSGDGGLSWQRVDTERVVGVRFADDQNGFAWSWWPWLRRTTDGGDSWTTVDIPVRGAIVGRTVNEGITAVLPAPWLGPGAWLLGGDMNRILVMRAGTATSTPPLREAGAGAVRIDGTSPNPFNPRVRVRFTLDAPATLRLDVFDARGRRVRAFAPRGFGRGPGSLVWDGRDDSGRPVASGSYHLRLATDRGFDVTRVVLVR